ncbi:hypothetical protein EYF80_002526 [Liparis tanakae]|uniref:Uncharacterized protein n=1 Tax=Liparis tanakae TaxID=230148 RepID=A0A4Z2JAF6_9TELE|nr:hypothetical protein EYF80_002526 [Liparis tanakae]
MRWKLLPWKLKACSNRTRSSTVHSSGNGNQKLENKYDRISGSCSSLELWRSRVYNQTHWDPLQSEPVGPVREDLNQFERT